MPNRQSVEVLDGADRAQRILDWTLFTYEQDRMLAHRDNEWNVGDPIHNMPTCDCDECGEQHIRSLFETTFPEDVGSDWSAIIVRCQDCEVNWAGSEPCFVCGIEAEPYGPLLIPDTYTRIPDSFAPHDRFLEQLTAYVQHDMESAMLADYRRAIEVMTTTRRGGIQFVATSEHYRLRRAEPPSSGPDASEMRGLSADYVVYNEAVDFDSELWERISANNITLPEGLTVTGRSEPTPPTMEQPSNRPELRDREAFWVRFERRFRDGGRRRDGV